MTKKGPSSRLKWLLICLFLVFFLTYLFGFLSIILLPIPGIFLLLKNKRWIWCIGGIAIFVAVLLGAGASQPHILVLLLVYSLITILFYEGWEQKWVPQKTIFNGTIVGLLAMLTGLGLFWIGTGNVSPQTFLEKEKSAIYQLVEQYKKDLSRYQWLDRTEEQVKWVDEKQDLIVETILRLMPSFVVGIVFISVFLNFFIVQHFFHNPDSHYQHNLSISEWRINDLLPWVVIIGLIFTMVKISVFPVIAFNVLIIMAIFYLTQGASVFLFFLNSWKMRLVWKIALLVIGLFLFYFYPILIIVGFSDTWIDFRKLRVKAA